MLSFLGNSLLVHGLASLLPSLISLMSSWALFYAAERVDTSDEPYLVEHTTSLMGIGPDGALRLIWASDVKPNALAADLEELLAQ